MPQDTNMPQDTKNKKPQAKQNEELKLKAKDIYKNMLNDRVKKREDEKQNISSELEKIQQQRQKTVDQKQNINQQIENSSQIIMLLEAKNKEIKEHIEELEKTIGENQKKIEQASEVLKQLQEKQPQNLHSFFSTILTFGTANLLNELDHFSKLIDHAIEQGYNEFKKNLGEYQKLLLEAESAQNTKRTQELKNQIKESINLMNAYDEKDKELSIKAKELSELSSKLEKMIKTIEALKNQTTDELPTPITVKIDRVIKTYENIEDIAHDAEVYSKITSIVSKYLDDIEYQNNKQNNKNYNWTKKPPPAPKGNPGVG